MKKFLVFLLFLFVLAAIAGGLIYYYRIDIFKMSADTIVKKMLPEYIDIDKLTFDLEKRTMEINGFGIRNPRQFTNKYIVHIDSIYCEYKLKGATILNGIEVTRIDANSPVITLERLRSGQLNASSMQEVISPPKKLSDIVSEKEASQIQKKMPKFDPGKMSDFFTITDRVRINDGQILFIDHSMGPRTLSYTFSDVQGTIILDLVNNYTELKELQTFGRGFVNADASQRIEWAIKYFPKTQALTMSNRFDVYGVEITQFSPYYDTYSPIAINRGRISGSLVFDFDNGNIGSTNTVTFHDLVFAPKPGSIADRYWAVGAGDLVQYLRSRSGDIYFDFKIKGNINDPRFYPGPIVKSAIQRLAMDKISEIVQQVQGGGQEGQAAAGTGAQAAPQSDAEKIMNIMTELLKKQ